MEEKLKQFKAIYGYKKDGFVKTFMANNKEHAEQLALEYQKQDNKGECKSDRIYFQRIVEVTPSKAY
jgi:LPS O-antigen subunit length determinant protein (WzzB/FepE family)